jgi:hypothetical protein
LGHVWSDSSSSIVVVFVVIIDTTNPPKKMENHSKERRIVFKCKHVFIHMVYFVLVQRVLGLIIHKLLFSSNLNI